MSRFPGPAEVKVLAWLLLEVFKQRVEAVGHGGKTTLDLSSVSLSLTY